MIHRVRARLTPCVTIAPGEMITNRSPNYAVKPASCVVIKLRPVYGAGRSLLENSETAYK